MMIAEKKKEIELGVFEQELLDNLREAYKNRFAKYVDEQNYETFTFEKKEDLNCNLVENGEPETPPYYNKNIANNVTNTTDTNKASPDIITEHINPVNSFKTFVEKKIYWKNPKPYDSYCTHKEKKNLEVFTVQQEKANQIIPRIIAIKNTISEIKNFLKARSDLQNNNSTTITKLLEKQEQIEDALYNIVKYGERGDPDFRKNFKCYKLLNDIIIHREQSMFDIIQLLKYVANTNSDNSSSTNNDNTNYSNENNLSTNDKNVENTDNNYTQADNARNNGRADECQGNVFSKTHTLNLLNLVSFQKQQFHDEFRKTVDKVDHLAPLLNNNCFQGKESVINMLLSFCFFFSFGYDENTYKRIINYIGLEYIKIKKWKEYLENEKHRKTENIISTLKLAINKYADKENVKNIMHIKIREYDKHVLTIYKKIVESEIQVQIISAEANKINEMIHHIEEKIEIDTNKLKSIFSKITE